MSMGIIDVDMHFRWDMLVGKGQMVAWSETNRSSEPCVHQGSGGAGLCVYTNSPLALLDNRSNDRGRYSVWHNTRTDTDTCFAYFTHPNSQDLSTSSLRIYRIPYRQHIEYNPQPGSLAHFDLIVTIAFPLAQRWAGWESRGVDASGIGKMGGDLHAYHRILY